MNRENQSTQRIPFTGKLGYAFGTISCSMSVILATFITYFMTENLAIPIVTASLVITLVKVLDGFTDVVGGILVDNTRTRWGKARPWYLFMAIPYGVCTAAIFFISPEASLTTKIILVAVLDALTVSIFGTMLNVARYALIPLMSKDPKQQETISILSDGLLGVMGSVFVVVSNLFVYDLGYKTMFTIFSIAGIVLLLLAFLLIREQNDEVERPKAEPVGQLLKAIVQNRYALTTLLIAFLMATAAGVVQLGGLYYFNNYLANGQALSLTMLLSIVGGLVALALLKQAFKATEKVLGFSLLAAAIMWTLAYFIAGPTNPVAAIICMGVGLVFLMNCGFGCVGMLAAKAVDYGEWKLGKRTEGMVSTCANVGQKIGTALGTALFGFVVGIGGFVEGGAQQTETALQYVRFGYTLLPAIICVVAAVLYFLLWRVDKQMPQIRAELAQRNKSE